MLTSISLNVTCALYLRGCALTCSYEDTAANYTLPTSNCALGNVILAAEAAQP